MVTLCGILVFSVWGGGGGSGIIFCLCICPVRVVADICITAEIFIN